jgi:hypothetical protein
MRERKRSTCYCVREWPLVAERDLTPTQDLTENTATKARNPLLGKSITGAERQRGRNQQQTHYVTTLFLSTTSYSVQLVGESENRNVFRRQKA